jgi:hypothetical protein
MNIHGIWMVNGLSGYSISHYMLMNGKTVGYDMIWIMGYQYDNIITE